MVVLVLLIDKLIIENVITLPWVKTVPWLCESMCISLYGCWCLTIAVLVHDQDGCGCWQLRVSVGAAIANWSLELDVMIMDLMSTAVSKFLLFNMPSNGVAWVAAMI